MNSGTVIYRFKLQATLKRNYQLMPALKWLRLLLHHVPDKNEHLARYYRYYSNRSRGARMLAEQLQDTSASIAIYETTHAKQWMKLLIRRAVGEIPERILPVSYHTTIAAFWTAPDDLSRVWIQVRFNFGPARLSLRLSATSDLGKIRLPAKVGGNLRHNSGEVLSEMSSWPGLRADRAVRREKVLKVNNPCVCHC